jgi:hypothetical protein
MYTTDSMANQLLLFTTAEDEVAMLRQLERWVLEVYPRRVPPDWKTFRARPDAHAQLPEEELYLVASEIGPAQVDVIKKGPDKGFWRVDEVRSPVIFWERSRLNEDGELVSGQLWAELEVTPQTGRRDAAPDRFRGLYLEVGSWLRKQFRKGDPKDYLVGPAAAWAVKERQLVLRAAGHRGGTVSVHR